MNSNFDTFTEISLPVLKKKVSPKLIVEDLGQLLGRWINIYVKCVHEFSSQMYL